MQVAALKKARSVFKSTSHAAICILLSSVLASGVFISHALSDDVEDAHAVAFVIPAAAAAVGMGGTEAVAAMAAIAGVLGFSVSSYVGATSNDVATWTPEQLDKAKNLDEAWVDHLAEHKELWDLFENSAEYAPDPEDPKPEPPKDPKDYNNSPLWRAAVLVNQGLLGVSALGFFADGLKNILSLNGSLEETVYYPDVTFVSKGVTYTAHVAAFPDVPSSYGDYYPAQAYINDTKIRYIYYPVSATAPSVEIRDNGYLFLLPKPSSNSQIDYDNFTGGASTDNFKWHTGGSYTNSFLVTDPYSFLSPTYAQILDKTYTNTTTLDNKHEIADAPQELTGWDVDAMKSYLNKIGSAASTGTDTVTVVKPTTTVVRDSWPDNVTKTDTELQPVTPEPDAPPTVTTPDWYDFPDSWNDGSIKWNRVFPFFFLDDLAQLFDKWFPQTEYKGKFSFTVPSFWGGGGGKTITVDFTPFEPFRPFVYYGSLSLIFVALLARLYTWWGGFKTDSDD